MQPILLGTDGSEPSRRAADVAVAFARALGCPLVLAHVMQAPFFVPANGIVPDLEQLLEQIRRERAESVIAEERHRIARPDLPLSTMVLDADPAHALADAAEAQDARFIVVGRHGRGAVSRLVSGSVSTKLVHVARRPVVVVP